MRITDTAEGLEESSYFQHPKPKDICLTPEQLPDSPAELLKEIYTLSNIYDAFLFIQLPWHGLPWNRQKAHIPSYPSCFKGTVSVIQKLSFASSIDRLSNSNLFISIFSFQQRPNQPQPIWDVMGMSFSDLHKGGWASEMDDASEVRR